MPTYKTPGVYIEEISVFPPSVAAVETAIPVFLGYTQKAVHTDGSDLTGVPKRITSLIEYEQYFGKDTARTYEVDVAQTVDDEGRITSTTVSFNGTAPSPTPFALLYHSIRLFYANGGGPCYILSLGAEPTDRTSLNATHFTDGLDSLQAYDEPTLILFPDAAHFDETGFKTVAEAALEHCSLMQDRFTILDVPPFEETAAEDMVSAFRGCIPIGLEFTKYGAAYFPYLETTLLPEVDESTVTIKSHTGPTTTITADTALDTESVRTTHSTVYNAVKAFLSEQLLLTLPPSGAVAGVYARIDGTRGVWHAPANASLLSVNEPAIDIVNEFNDSLNVDTTAGKSINAIRAFTGKGTLVWGARTLAGNDNENRYISVRRFLIFAEESIKKATTAFVFEPNDANTWVKVKSMIDNFLVVQWRDGALAGAKPEDAFYVAVGLNKTMTAQDILEGYMIVEIGLAIVRPAEFIVLRFMQQMQTS